MHEAGDSVAAPSPGADAVQPLRFLSTYAILLWALATLLRLWELPSSLYSHLSRAACAMLAVVAALQHPLAAPLTPAHTVLVRLPALALDADYALFLLAELELARLFVPHTPWLSDAGLRACQGATLVAAAAAMVCQCIRSVSQSDWVFRGFNIFMGVAALGDYAFQLFLVRFVMMDSHVHPHPHPHLHPQQWPRHRRRFRLRPALWWRLVIVTAATTLFAVLGCLHMLAWVTLRWSAFDRVYIFRLCDAFQLMSVQTMLALREALLVKPVPETATTSADVEHGEGPAGESARLLGDSPTWHGSVSAEATSDALSPMADSASTA
ncbi:hypothetical protein HK105_207064 [Polyrhizophydium stewartii]|uniref:Uncharacterized protein n=1 Tax=Polyrhizophydium stewartii TaxID=2732419 RepID=A0ABR4N1P0_9FUNG